MDKKPTPKSKVDISPRGVASVSGSVDGGIIFGDNAKVSVGGDMVGRDKIVTTTTTTGMSAADFAAIFDRVYQRVNQLAPAKQEDVREAVDTIKAEAEKEAVAGKQPDEKMVKMASNALVSMAPDILDVALTTVANPAAGVAAIIRKVLEKARATSGSGA